LKIVIENIDMVIQKMGCALIISLNLQLKCGYQIFKQQVKIVLSVRHDLMQ